MLLVRHMRTGFVLGWFFFWFFFSRTMCVCSLHALQRDRWAGMLLIKSNAQKGKKYPEVKSKDGKSKSKDIVLKHYFGRSHLQETNTTWWSIFLTLNVLRCRYRRRRPGQLPDLIFTTFLIFRTRVWSNRLILNCAALARMQRVICKATSDQNDRINVAQCNVQAAQCLSKCIWTLFTPTGLYVVLRGDTKDW